MTDTLPTGTITEWTDTQWDNFSYWLENLLREEVVEIVFTKTDGSQRVMNCTKKNKIITEGVKLLEQKRAAETTDSTQPVKSKRNVPFKVGNITVWDVDSDNWRSFRIRSITNILTLILKYDYREPTTNLYEVMF